MKAFLRCLVPLCLACAISSALGQVTVSLAPDSAIVTPGKTVTLILKVDGAVDNIHCILTDYRDQNVAKPLDLPVKSGEAQYQLSLPRGYYQLAFPQAKQTFGIVSMEEPKASRDPFFCIDAALSWLVRDIPARGPLVRNLARCGIAMARERVTWGSINPGPGKFNWQTGLQYQALREEYKSAGIAVLDVFHDGAAWCKRDANVTPYPADLIQTAGAWGQIGRQWEPYWGGLEIWNEPDISRFGGELPADQYVPMVKAVSYGLAGAGVKSLVGGGVFTDDVSNAFRNACARDGLLDRVDFISIHNYTNAGAIEGQIKNTRDWLKAFDKESMPIWISESGWPWDKGPARAPAAQDAASATEIVAKAVEAKACGVARYFSFVYPYYEEGGKNFAMTGSDGTPMRSFAAYAQCVRALGAKSYVGDLRLDGVAVAKARVFVDDKEAVAVLYAGPAATAATVKLNMSALRVEGIDGRALQQANDGSVSLADGIVYAYLAPEKLADLLDKNTQAQRLLAVAAKAPPLRPRPSPVVLQFLPELKGASTSNLAYQIDRTDGTLSLRFRVSNLSQEKLAVRLSLGAAPSPPLSHPVSVAVSVPADQVKDVQVDADKSIEATFDVNLRTLPPGPTKTVRIVASDTNGSRLDSLWMNFKFEQTIEEYLRPYKVKSKVPLDKLPRWTKNMIDDAKMDLAATPEGHWVMNVKFAKNDPWAYPKFRLPEPTSRRVSLSVRPRGRSPLRSEELDISKAAAIVIRGKCEGAAAVRIMLTEKEGAVYFTSSAIFPADGKWHVALVPVSELTFLGVAGSPDKNGKLDMDQVVFLSIGLNSKAKENTLEISDVYFCGME
ncbi:MAG: hypothetical protein ABSB25_01505 [Sedimentisphaerales bacterium]